MDQTKPQPRRRLSLGLLLAAMAVAALGYGYYLYHGSQTRPLAPTHAAAASVAVTAKPAAAAAEKTAAAATVAASVPAPQVSSAVKNSTEAGIAGAWNHMLETINAAKAPPVAAPHPQIMVIGSASAQPEAGIATIVAPVAAKPVAAKPAAPRWRPLTAEQRLARAGEVAMENMLIQATKYPDSYGFRAEDAFEKATLGKAIPIYTISEADRAKYQTGQRLQPLLKSTGQWMFPVLSGDHLCCMVKVKYDGHEYASGNSSKALADAWSVISEKWPAAAGFHPQLVVYPGMPGYYFTVPELPVPNVTDTVKMTAYQPDVSPADVILASWR